MTSQISRLFAVLAVLMLLAGSTARAQLTTATITGTITDATSAVVPGAKITAVNTATKFTRSVESGGDGSFRLEFLPIGDYSVTVGATGFETIRDQKVTLNLNAEIRFDARLRPGQADQTVSVNANDEPLVQTTNATLGRVIDNTEVDNLPIVDRNVYQLLSVTAGVQSNTQTNTLGYPQQVVYINGGYDNGTGSVSYYLDGGNNMTMLRNTGNLLPNPDALQEFNVQTNNYSALYGRMSAGLVNVVTKSGTNSVHGSVFEFFRDTNMAATPAYSLTKPALHKHEFGATLGGPVVVPGLYDGKDKTFFFGSYGGHRYITSSVYNSALVPTLAEYNSGLTNFSDRIPVSSGTITTATACTATISAADKALGNFLICNPLTQKLQSSGGVVNAGVTADPVSVNILKYLVSTGAMTPGGNITINGLPAQQDVAQSHDNNDEFLLKIDHNLTANQRLEVAYFNTVGNILQLPSSNLNWATQIYTYRQQNANVSDTWTINSRMINQVFLNYTRQDAGRSPSLTTNLSNFGSSFTPQGLPSLPQITVTGFFTLANSISGPQAVTNFYSYRDVFSLNKGKHALAFGTEGQLDKDIQSTLLNNYGVMTFATTAKSRSGNVLSDFAYGLPSAFEQDSTDVADANDYFFGFFAQDDYKVLPHLTLNLGVRWDFQTAPTDNGQNRESAFIPGQQSTVLPSAPLGLNFVGDPHVTRGVISTSYTHFSPRVGFAWDPFGDGKTAVRGGFGAFYGLVSGNDWDMMSNYSPFAERFKFPSTAFGTNPAAETSLSNPYAGLNGGINPFPYIYNKAAAFPTGFEPSQLDSTDLGFKWPLTYQTNLSIQQQLPWSLVLTVSYVGSSSHNLPFANDINAPVLNAPVCSTPTTCNAATASTSGNADQRRPILPGQLTSIYNLQSHQRAHYNGLQVLVDKRLTKTLSLKGYYAWSKTLATMQIQGTTAQPSPSPQDYNAQYEEYGRTDDDFRNMSVTSIVWKPNYFSPSERVLHAVADGWSISAIATLRSGQPFTLTTGADNNFSGTTSYDRPSVAPGQSYKPTIPFDRHNNTTTWFNPAYFCTPNGTTCPGIGPGNLDGNTRRDDYSGPVFHSVDAALFRDFGIYERLKFQIRCEASNVFNIVNLNNPATGASKSTFGTITGANPMRQIQIGGRLLF